MHSELDDQRPITEATEPKVRSRLETGPDWKRELSGRGRKTTFDPRLPFEGEDKFGRLATTRVQSGDGPTISQP